MRSLLIRCYPARWRAGAAVTAVVGDGDGDEVNDSADVEAPPVAHAISVRPRARTKSVGLRDAMTTSGSART